MVLGLAASLFASLGPAALLLALVVAVIIAMRHAGVVGLSGVLFGFGASWTLVIVAWLASGGMLDSMSWLAVGAGPLAIGVSLLAYSVRGDRGVESRAKR